MLWQLRIRLKYIMNKPRTIYGYKNVLHTHLDIQVLSTCWGWGELMWQLLSTVSSVQFSHSVVSNSWRPHRLQHTRLPCRLVTPGPCAQGHVHWVGDVIQPSHPLSSPSPSMFNLYQHQGLFQWVGSSHQVAKVLEFRLQDQSFQWIFRTDFL